MNWKPPIYFAFLLLLFSLTSCDIAVIDPKGIIAASQRDLIYTTLGLMLLVVMPVLVLTLVFAWRYRASAKARYEPEWDHNTLLEYIWWGIQILIIGVLAVITWKSSHELDPYKPLEQPGKPIEIQVVALDWKWLFIYPTENVAVVNFVQFPVGVPVNFKITAQAPMNSFWIPSLAGQIYAMEGMQTKLHIMASEPGNYEGVSANFSGEGFNGMKFFAKASSTEEYTRWIDSLRHSPDTLTRTRYDALALPSSNDPVRIYSAVADQLFLHIMMQFMMPGCGNGCDKTSHACCRRQSMDSAHDMPMDHMPGMSEHQHSPHP